METSPTAAESELPSILPEAVYSKSTDYDFMLSMLDKETKFYDIKRQVIRKELNVIEGQMQVAAQKASKGLEQA